MNATKTFSFYLFSLFHILILVKTVFFSKLYKFDLYRGPYKTILFEHKSGTSHSNSMYARKYPKAKIKSMIKMKIRLPKNIEIIVNAVSIERNNHTYILLNQISFFSSSITSLHNRFICFNSSHISFWIGLTLLQFEIKILGSVMNSF